MLISVFAWTIARVRVGFVQTCQVFDSEWKWPAVFAGGGYVRVARVFEEDGIVPCGDASRRGSGEGRGGDGGLR